MATKRIACIYPNPTDATSFYRGAGVMPYLRHLADVECVRPTQVFWPEVAEYDCVYLQRPSSADSMVIATLCKEMNVPLVVDYDDDLFSVPMDNPCYEQYADKQTQKNISEVIAMATAVTVSTKQLQRKLLPLNKNITVVPNALNDYIFGAERPGPLERNTVVQWRGGASHANDIFSHGKEIIELAHSWHSKQSNWVFSFIGYHPWFLTKLMPAETTVVVQTLTLTQYMAYLAQVSPQVMMVPLVANEFNRAKSNIAWLEACRAGAVTVAPDMEEWRVPGCVNYDNAKDFGRSMNEIMSCSPEANARLADEGWAHIKRHLMLSHVNKRRLEAFAPVVGGIKWAS